MINIQKVSKMLGITIITLEELAKEGMGGTANDDDS